MPLTPQRLKRLVKYRERLERLQEQEFGKANTARNERAAALAAVANEKSQYLESHVPSGAVDLTQLVANQAYSARLDRLHSARSAALRYSEQQVEQQRTLLLAKSRDRKAMERLLERRLEDDRLLARRDEAKALDEAAIARWTPPSPGMKGTAA
jgi:flagellar export protein FliJ